MTTNLKYALATIPVCAFLIYQAYFIISFDGRIRELEESVLRISRQQTLSEQTIVRAKQTRPGHQRRCRHARGMVSNPGESMSTEIEEAVINKIRARRDAGRKKYGVSMERDDLSHLDWLRHAQDEAADFCIYLEKLIQEEEKRYCWEDPPFFPESRTPTPPYKEPPAQTMP
jgi:hypothetical protein